MLPLVERADDGNRLGVRRPHGEMATTVGGLGAESAVEVSVGALVEQVPVDFVGMPVEQVGAHVGPLAVSST